MRGRSGRDGRVLTTSPLPRPVLIYDDACAFCRRWVRRLKRWDRRDRIALLPLQDERAASLAGRPRHALEHAAHAVLPSGEVVAGAAALRALCGYLPGGALPRAVLGVPGALPLAERLYAWVARRWGPVGPGVRER